MVTVARPKERISFFTLSNILALFFLCMIMILLIIIIFVKFIITEHIVPLDNHSRVLVVSQSFLIIYTLNNLSVLVMVRVL